MINIGLLRLLPIFAGVTYGDMLMEMTGNLNVTRLEDGWFLYRLVQEFAGFGILEEVNFGCYTSGNRRNVELLCQRAMMYISISSPKWVQHCCNVPGCREGMVTIDGNEKLTRAMCAAPKSKVMCPVNHINLVQCCTQSPITGGGISRLQNFAVVTVTLLQHLIQLCLV